jgi:hypothetical protein
MMVLYHHSSAGGLKGGKITIVCGDTSIKEARV